MSQTNPIELTNMALITNDQGQFLVQQRLKPDWPGITFPGGHIEPGESCHEAIIREVQEETGLTLVQPKLCGIGDFMMPGRPNIGFALLGVTIGLFALEMVMGRRLQIHTMLINVTVVIGIVIVLPQFMGVLNDFTEAATSEVGKLKTADGESTSKKSTNSMALQVIKNNVVDVGTLAKNSFSVTPNDIVKSSGALNGLTDQNIRAVDFGVMIKDGKKDGSGNFTGDYEDFKLDSGVTASDVLKYGLNSEPETGSSWKDGVIKVSNSHWVFKQADTGYQRYIFSFFPIITQALVLIGLFILSGIKVVKLIFELGIMRVLAVITAFSSLKSSVRVKELISTIFWSYMSIVMQLSMIKIFMIFINYGSAMALGAANLNLAEKGFVIIILYIGAFYGVFSGSGFIDRLSGVQSGSGSEVQQFMATYGGARLLGGAAAKGVGAGLSSFTENANSTSTPMNMNSSNPNLETAGTESSPISQNNSDTSSSSSNSSQSQTEAKDNSTNNNQSDGLNTNSNDSQQTSDQSIDENNSSDTNETIDSNGSAGTGSSDSLVSSSNGSTVNEVNNGNSYSSENSGGSNNLGQNNIVPGAGTTNLSTGGKSASNVVNDGSYQTNANLQSEQSSDNMITNQNSNLGQDSSGSQQTTNNVSQSDNSSAIGESSSSGTTIKPSSASGVEYQPAEQGNPEFTYPTSNNGSGNNNGVYSSGEGYANQNLKTPFPDSSVPNPDAKSSNLNSPLQNQNDEAVEPRNASIPPNYSQSSGLSGGDTNQTNYDSNNLYNNFGSEGINPDNSINPGSSSDESSNDDNYQRDYQASAGLSNAMQSFEQSIANDPILSGKNSDDNVDDYL